MIDFEDYARLTDVEWRSVTEIHRGIFIAEGLTTITRALASGCVPRSAVCEQRWLSGLVDIGFPAHHVTVVSEGDMHRIAGFHVHRGALAAFQRPVQPDLTELLDAAQRLVVIEDVVDHTNIGAIIRSAAAFDIDAVLLTPRCADPLYRRAIKVSMGTVFNIRWARIDWPSGLSRLHDAGFLSLALSPNADAARLQDVSEAVRSQRLALLLGTEGPGLHPKTLRDASRVVRIPMAHGVDSLNVAAAAAVACFELTR